MHMTLDTYVVYVFPNGIKRLSWNMAALTLNRLILQYGKPIKTEYSYERVMEEGIK